MPKAGIIAVSGLFSGGVTVAFLEPADLGTWIAAVAAICAAFIWMGRMIWSASRVQQCVLGKIGAQSDRLDHLMSEITAHISSTNARLEGHETVLKELVEKLARIDARCEERGRAANKRRPKP